VEIDRTQHIYAARYELFDDGVIIRDMSHGKLLADVTD
jgi:hypothetical protein